MKKILLTATGCPGAPSIIKLLKNHYDLYGVDCDSNATGFHLIDGEVIGSVKFKNSYRLDISRICTAKNIDFVLPMSTQELLPLSITSYYGDGFGSAQILVSPPEGLSVAIDKGSLYERFEGEDFIPEFYVCRTLYDWIMFLMGSFLRGGDEWFVKPCQSCGSRGLFKITESHALDFSSKPVPYQVVDYRNMENFLHRNFKSIREMNGILITKFLKGREWSVDCVVYDDFFVGVSRIREEIRCGICTKGRIVMREELLEISKKICRELGLRFNINLQFIETEEGFKLIEINPRVSGTIVLSSQMVNLPQLAIELAGGKADVTKPFHIQTERGFKNMVRMYREVFY